MHGNLNVATKRDYLYCNQTSCTIRRYREFYNSLVLARNRAKSFVNNTKYDGFTHIIISYKRKAKEYNADTGLFIMGQAEECPNRVIHQRGITCYPKPLVITRV